MKKDFNVKVGDNVVKITWDDDDNAIVVRGEVSRVTKTTFDVDYDYRNSDQSSLVSKSNRSHDSKWCVWHRDSLNAINAEFQRIFGARQLMFENKLNKLSNHRLARRVVSLLRLERKILDKRKRRE